MMVAAANERIADAWEFADWPDLTKTELRNVQGDGTSGWYIDLEQSGQTDIGTVFGIFRDNPATHVAPRQIQFNLEQEKILLPEGSDLPASVYVRFRTRPTTYLTSNLTADVPAVLSKAVGYYLAAEALTEDGQVDKAMVMEQAGEADLIKEYDKVVFQQDQPRRWTARL
jgi:hypothetical protein